MVSTGLRGSSSEPRCRTEAATRPLHPRMRRALTQNGGREKPGRMPRPVRRKLTGAGWHRCSRVDDWRRSSPGVVADPFPCYFFAKCVGDMPADHVRENVAGCRFGTTRNPGTSSPRLPKGTRRTADPFCTPRVYVNWYRGLLGGLLACCREAIGASGGHSPQTPRGGRSRTP